MNLAFRTEYIFDEGSIKWGKEPRIGDCEPSLDYRWTEGTEPGGGTTWGYLFLFFFIGDGGRVAPSSPDPFLDPPLRSKLKGQGPKGR